MSTSKNDVFDAVVSNGTKDLQTVRESLTRHDARWCVIGGMAVNAYVEPVYTADCDLVVEAGKLDQVLDDLRAANFRIKVFPYSINAQRRASPTEKSTHMLMIQFSKSPEMQDFVHRAVKRTVMGFEVPVAALVDLVNAKLDAWREPQRRPNKRRKDELDILRLAESYPEVVDPILPAELLEKARTDRATVTAQIAARPEGDGWGAPGSGPDGLRQGPLPSEPTGEQSGVCACH